LLREYSSHYCGDAIISKEGLNQTLLFLGFEGTYVNAVDIWDLYLVGAYLNAFNVFQLIQSSSLTHILFHNSDMFNEEHI